MTLAEDFDINEEVHAGLGTGTNTDRMFDCYQGALHHFNAEIERIVT